MNTAKANIKTTVNALTSAYLTLNKVHDTLGNDKCASTPKQREMDANELKGEVASLRKLLDEVEQGIMEDLEANVI
jgi:hypothetical protein